MSYKIFPFIFLFVCFNFSSAAKLPPYFSQCSINDTSINDCLVHNANGGLHAFLKGDKTYNIQSLLPLYIPYITLNADKNLRINLTNCIISELEGAKVKDAKVSLDDQQIELALYMPRATLSGQYTIKGKMSQMPINERGLVNITVTHSRMKYNFNYTLLERKEKHYVNITESRITYKSERSFYTFHNLFPDHPFLSRVIHTSLNSNWMETSQEFAPVVSAALCDITTTSLKGFFEKVPYEELFGE